MIFPFCKTAAALLSARPGPLRIFFDETDAERHRADLSGRFGQRGQIGRHKIVTQEQVARRIAAKKEFRCQDEFRPAGDGLRVGGQKLFAIARKVTDRRIKLEQTDLQGGEISNGAVKMKSRNQTVSTVCRAAARAERCCSSAKRAMKFLRNCSPLS